MNKMNDKSKRRNTTRYNKSVRKNEGKSIKQHQRQWFDSSKENQFPVKIISDDE